MKRTEIKVPTQTYYTIRAGAYIDVPIFDSDGNEICTNLYKTAEDICVYVEGEGNFTATCE